VCVVRLTLSSLCNRRAAIVALQSSLIETVTPIVDQNLSGGNGPQVGTPECRKVELSLLQFIASKSRKRKGKQFIFSEVHKCYALLKYAREHLSKRMKITDNIGNIY
jgi:hypothetical protein